MTIAGRWQLTSNWTALCSGDQLQTKCAVLLQHYFMCFGKHSLWFYTSQQTSLFVSEDTPLWRIHSRPFSAPKLTQIVETLSTAFKGKARSRFDWWWLILASTTPTSNWSYPLFPTVLMLYQTPLDRTRSLEMRTSDPWKWRLRRDSGCIETKVKLSQFW